MKEVNKPFERNPHVLLELIKASMNKNQILYYGVKSRVSIEPKFSQKELTNVSTEYWGCCVTSTIPKKSFEIIKKLEGKLHYFELEIEFKDGLTKRYTMQIKTCKMSNEISDTTTDELTYTPSSDEGAKKSRCSIF